ncbi:MAG: glycosyltransferase family 39 protein, partial [Deltaproteobacteria bacterium]|nr:glycosyltransferase family 39 protein [Deltaproteobacteria bacterium]
MNSNSSYLNSSLYAAGGLLGVLSFFIFSLGHLKVLSPVPIGLGLIVFLSFFVWHFRAAPILFLNYIKSLSKTELLIFAGIVLVIFSAFLLALCPPSVRDELILHLALPKLFLQNNSILKIPSLIGFSLTPMNIDLLYLVPLAFKNDIIPRVLHLFFSVLTSLVLYSYIAGKYERVYALLGALFFLSTPMVFNLSTMAYTDLALTFFTSLAFFGVLRWAEAGCVDKKMLIYSALAIGFALGCKYNVLISFMLLTFFIIYIYSTETKDQLGAIKFGALFFFISLLVFSPWLIRNFLWTGSPLYPVINFPASSPETSNLFVGGAISPLLKRSLLYGESFTSILLVPLRLFFGGADNSMRYFDAVLNPFFLFFIPLAFLKNKFWELRYVSIFVFLVFFLSFFTVDLVTRYLMPVFPFVILIAILGLKNSLESKKLRIPAGIILVLFLLFNANYVLGQHKTYKPVEYLLSGESRVSYLLRILPDYEVTVFANATLPQDARVLFLFTGERGYYWKRDHIYAMREGGDLISYVRGSSTAEELRGKFKKKGVTHLFLHADLFNKFVIDNFKGVEYNLLAEFTGTHLKHLHSANDFALYEL